MGLGLWGLGFRIYKFRAPNDQPFELIAMERKLATGAVE